ncbi:MAG: ferric reductase-like transmembrane domain-containing protein [Xanthobacteraceae bacterium]|nr:ferric reductase-like transmembrane domain-containing protein [Xanthobacteraceae bacterium]
MAAARIAMIWAVLVAAIGAPIALAATSPFLQWHDAIYIAACFAGIIALGLLLVQPLLITGYLPGLSAFRARRAHHWVGGTLVVAIIVHVAGLWITSPPDMLDALLFRSPTLFSPFGVVAMWAIFATATLALFRRRLGLRTWRITHMSLAVVIVGGSVIHGMLIEGTMETMSKAALCALVVAAIIKVMVELWPRKKPVATKTENASNPR